MTRFLPVRRILVPVDLTRPFQSLVDYAVGLAQQLGAELMFLTVIDSPTMLALIEQHPSAGGPDRGNGFRDKLIADAKVLLGRMVEIAGRSQVRALGHAVVSEKVGDEVVREATEREADLIVLAAQEHSILWEFLFGDSAEEITHRAPCPVLTIKTRT